MPERLGRRPSKDTWSGTIGPSEACIKLNKNNVFRNTSDFYRISIIFQEESYTNHLPVIMGVICGHFKNRHW